MQVITSYTAAQSTHINTGDDAIHAAQNTPISIQAITPHDAYRYRRGRQWCRIQHTPIEIRVMLSYIYKNHAKNYRWWRHPCYTIHTLEWTPVKQLMYNVDIKANIWTSARMWSSLKLVSSGLLVWQQGCLTQIIVTRLCVVISGTWSVIDRLGARWEWIENRISSRDGHQGPRSLFISANRRQTGTATKRRP